uniref:Uncharacterized protein n=1 Tax=Trypanosoma vivax (strain Y486) TaxID=1055687 RepID=G0UDB5_TRYVY|nr:hypothetical protein TVY486_1113100 [Trypanosoma vivax Y486]
MEIRGNDRMKAKQTLFNYLFISFGSISKKQASEGKCEKKKKKKKKKIPLYGQEKKKGQANASSMQSYLFYRNGFHHSFPFPQPCVMQPGVGALFLFYLLWL